MPSPSLIASLLLLFSVVAAQAADVVRIAAQRTGTLAWELDVVKRHNLADKAGLKLEVVALASPLAQKVALKGGAADVIVADLMWAVRERALGGRTLYHPFSSAVGALLTPPGSPIKSLADLRGRKLAVGGGPLDKSWILTQALAGREGLKLASEAEIVYGAPPLINEKARQGEFHAVLNYWNFGAELEAAGFNKLLDMVEVQKRLGAKDGVAMLGYVFDETWALANRDALDRFLAVMAEAKRVLVASDDEWRALAPLIKPRDDAMLARLRDAYRAGVPRREAAEEARDAATLLRIIVEGGGADLIAPARGVDPAMFYTPASRT